jgi:hypothetical protein
VRNPKHRIALNLSAGITFLALLVGGTASQAHAQCHPEFFADHATDPNFFWSDVDCAADKSLVDQFGAIVPSLVFAGWTAAFNAEAPGLGTAIGKTMTQVMDSAQGGDAFGPSTADLMRAVQFGTNNVISRVNENFSNTDLAHVKSVQDAYLLYQSDPRFYMRVAKASAEWANNGEWFDSLNLLALDRHGPLALHASLSLAEVFARRMMDLELAYEVMYTTPPSNPPPNPRYDAYLASATAEDRAFWADRASIQAVRDVQVIFNGGILRPNAGTGGVRLPGLFDHVARLGNGGLREYSNSRFSAFDYTDGGSQDTCGGDIGFPKSFSGHYHFPLDPNDPAANEQAPRFNFEIWWSPCTQMGTNALWTLQVTDSDGQIILEKYYRVPPLANGRADYLYAMDEAVQIIQQAAYEKFLTMSYGAVRPKLDQWWKIVGNAGYSSYVADDELDELVMRSSAVSEAVWRVEASARDWSEDASPNDIRQLTNYALLFGAGGIDELYHGAQQDRMAWNTNAVRASDYRRFLASQLDPAGVAPYFRGQMAAKVMAVLR